MQVAVLHQVAFDHGAEGLQPLVAPRRRVPVAALDLVPPLQHEGWVVTGHPRVVAPCPVHRKRRQHVLPGKAAQVRRLSPHVHEAVHPRLHVLGSDQLRKLRGQRPVLGAAQHVRLPRRVVLDQAKIVGHRVRHVLPEPVERGRRHRHEHRMPHVRAQHAAVRGDAQPVHGALRVQPGHPRLRGHAHLPALVAKRLHQRAEVVNLNGVKLAVAVSRVRPVQSRGMAAPHVLPHHARVDPVVSRKRRRQRNPDPMQILPRQSVGHLVARHNSTPWSRTPTLPPIVRPWCHLRPSRTWELISSVAFGTGS